MWISDFAIRRPVITLVTMLAIVVFGLFSLFSLDTDEYPEVNPPVVSVAVPYPGASPDVVEREVIDPMEEGITSVWTSMGITSSPFVPPSERIRGRGGEDRRVPSKVAAGGIMPVDPPTAFLK